MVIKIDDVGKEDDVEVVVIFTNQYPVRRWKT